MPRDVRLYFATLWTILLGSLASALIVIHTWAAANWIGAGSPRLLRLVGAGITFPKWLGFLQSWIQPTDHALMGTIGFVLLSIVFCLILLPLVILTAFTLEVKVPSTVRNLQQYGVELHTFPPGSNFELLAIQIEGDEAHRVLGMADFLLEFPMILFGFLSNAILSVVGIAGILWVFSDWVWGLFAVGLGLAGRASLATGIVSTSMGYLISAQLVLAISYFVWQAVLLAFAWIPSIAFGQSAGFSLWVRTAVTPEPPYARSSVAKYAVAPNAFREYISMILRLKHSAVYKEARVITDVLQWIKSHLKVPAKICNRETRGAQPK